MFDLLKNLSQCFPMFREKNQLARLYGNHPNDEVNFVTDASVVKPRRFFPSPEQTDAVILLQHGFISVPEVWDTWIEKIPKERIAISAPLMAGCGLSDFEKTWDYDEEDWYNGLKEEYQELKEKYPNAPFILVGHSLGGTLVTRLASEFKEKNLFLVAPYFFLKSSDQLQAKYLLPILKNFFPKLCVPSNGGHMHSEDKKKQGEITYTLNNWKLAESLIKSGELAQKAASSLEKDTDVYILQGTYDAILDPNDFERVFELFDVDNKSMKSLESGHVIQVDGASDQGLSHLEEFITKAIDKSAQ